jgi:hypothetical protein
MHHPPTGYCGVNSLEAKAIACRSRDGQKKNLANYLS